MRPQTTCSVTDDGVHHLLALRELTELTIDNSKATGECLRDLAKLPKLQHLGCSRLEMSEADVQSFRDFKMLKSVVMYETIVDEQWIPFLESLNLEWVAFTVTDKSRVDEIHDRNGKPRFAVD